MRLAVDIALTLFLCLGGSELLLRVPGLFGAAQGDLRQGASRAHFETEVQGARHRVVCLGDSFTFGAGVDERQSYPEQLAQKLEATSPGRFEVLNFGITALDSAIARERLKILLRRLTPSTVVFWVGSNDTAIGAEAGGEGLFEHALSGLARHSRLALLLVSEIQDRRVARTWQFATGQLGPIGAPLLAQREESETLSRIEDNLERMVRLSREAGAAPVLMTYPGHAARMQLANQAIANAAERHNVPLVVTLESIRRLPREDRKYLWAMHPNAHMYTVIAQDVAAQVVSSDSSAGSPGVPAENADVRRGESSR